MMDILTWLGIVFCISQSAMFSGLNLAMFGISRMSLEVEASAKNRAAIKILRLRKDANFLLTTILWGNVGINVLLTLLTNSVMAGVSAFLFSTALITLVGEITPQAYFSRNALRMGGLLAPVLRFYQVLLYPVAKPAALLLDMWLGKEGVEYFREEDLRRVITKHVKASESDIGFMEGMGALNFLDLDDRLLAEEGVVLDPLSIISLPVANRRPVFPAFKGVASDPFLRMVNASGKKWVTITDGAGEPVMVIDADDFLRHALLNEHSTNPNDFCHRPIIVRDPGAHMGKAIVRFKASPKSDVDNVIDNDLILLWAKDKRIITGADILGRLLYGIVKEEREA